MRIFPRLLGAFLPVILASIAFRVYAQTEEQRLRTVEMNLARQDERYIALAARIESIDHTLWWLIASTFASGGVSGAVAADRAIYRTRKQ